MANPDESFPALLATTERFDTVEAWETLFPKAQNTRDALIEAEVIPADLALLTEAELEDLMSQLNIKHYLIKPKLRRVRDFLLQKSTKEGKSSPAAPHASSSGEKAKTSAQPHPEDPEDEKERSPAHKASRTARKFTLPLPRAEGVSTPRFLSNFAQFITREQVEDQDIFQTLLLCVPDKSLMNVVSARTSLEGKPWKTIKARVRQLLEPAKSASHYMTEFLQLRPTHRESIQDYNIRFNEFREILDLGLDSELVTNTYLNSLPQDVRQWIRTVQAAKGDDTGDLDELQALVAKCFDDPTAACFEPHERFERKQLNVRVQLQPNAAPSSNKRNMECFYCGKPGHFASECRKRKHDLMQPSQPPLQSHSRPPQSRQTMQSHHQQQPAAFHNKKDAPPRVSSVKTVSADQGPSHPVAEEDPALLQRIHLVNPMQLDMETLKESQDVDRELAKQQLAEPPISVPTPPKLPIPLVRPTINVTLNDVVFNAQLDTGADVSCISKSALELIPECSYSIGPDSLQLKLAEGGTMTRPLVRLAIVCSGKRVVYPFAILNTESTCVLLGIDLINLFSIQVPILTSEQLSTAFQDFQVTDIETILDSQQTEQTRDTIPHPEQEQLTLRIQDAIDANLLTANDHSTLEPIPIVFADPQDRTRGSWQPQFRMPEETERQYEAQIQNWLDKGILEPQLDHVPQETDEHGTATGLFNTRSFAIMSNKLRFVQDFPHINGKIVEDTNDVPTIDDAFLRIARARPVIFTHIDLIRAYLQVPLRKCDRAITAITSSNKRYRFVTAPLGLKHLPAAFNRRIRSLLQQCGCSNYTHNHMDDIIVFSSSIEDHVQHVRNVLSALTSVKLAISLALNLTAHPHRDRTISGWISKLSEFTFTTFHLPGERNTLADLASRVQSISTPSQPMNDDTIETILQEAHSLGHFGASGMFRHIKVTKQIDWIPNLMERCLEFCKKCSVCRRVNTNRVGYSPLEQPKSMTPCRRWHTDLVEMNKSKSGNKYLIVVVDDFTRFTWLRATPRKDAETVTSQIINIGSEFGFPSMIKTDQGTEFDNVMMRELERAVGAHHQFVLPYNHHANGTVERANRTVRDTLLKLTLEATGKTSDWDQYLSITQLFLNARFHNTVMSTPFSLMFGRSAFPAGGDDWSESPIKGSSSSTTLVDRDKESADDLKRWKEFWTTFQQSVIPHLHDVQAHAHEKRVRTYRKKITEFKPGDVVMYRDPTITSKSQPRNKGPFAVKEILPHGKLLIMTNDGSFESPANFLKRAALKPGEQLASLFDNTSDDDGSEDEINDLCDATYVPPIEISNEEVDPPASTPNKIRHTTRSGRVVKAPQRFSTM